MESFPFLRRVIVSETGRKESDTIRQECGTRLEIGGNWRGSKIGEKKKVFQSVASPLAGSDGAMVLFCHSKSEDLIKHPLLPLFLVDSCSHRDDVREEKEKKSAST